MDWKRNLSDLMSAVVGNPSVTDLELKRVVDTLQSCLPPMPRVDTILTRPRPVPDRTSVPDSLTTGDAAYFDREVTYSTGAFPHTIRDDQWVVDSGSSAHICKHEDLFVELWDIETRIITTGDKRHALSARKRGIVSLDLDVNGRSTSVRLADAYFIPEASQNLFSITAVESKHSNIVSTFRNNRCEFRAGDKLVATGTKVGNLYYLDLYADSALRHVEAKTVPPAASTHLSLVHRRYGHLAYSGLKQLLNTKCVNGLNLSANDFSTTPFCVACTQAKSHRLPKPKASSTEVKQILDLVSSDLCGPFRTDAFGGYRYFMTLTDHKSRHATLYLLKKKSEAFSHYVEYENFATVKHERKIKTFRADNGGEYTSNQFRAHLKKAGTKLQLTIRESSFQNGVSERLNRTIMEMARSMLMHAKLPPAYWGYAVLTAVYIRNRCLTRINPAITPHEIWEGTKPNVSNLKVFGCPAYAHITMSEGWGKLDPKTTLNCTFIGYCSEHKGYRLRTADNRVISRRDVTFDESMGNLVQPDSGTIISIEDDDASNHNSPPLAPVEAVVDDDAVGAAPILSPVPAIARRLVPPMPSPPNLRSSSRSNRGVPSSRVQDFVNLMDANETTLYEPIDYDDAISCSERKSWISAMDEELSSLAKHDVWDLVDLPAGKKAIGNKWVYKLKRSNGTVTRYKARLTAKGFSQRHGIDYNETFAPVAKYTTIRVVLALAAKHDLELRQLDVVTAFLYGILKEEIYMKQPFGLNGADPSLVCKLKKGLYGLKQAGREWNADIHAFLIDLGFFRSSADACVYILAGDTFIIIVVYVDDLLLAYRKCDETKSNNIIDDFSRRYAMKDLGEASWLLGVKISRNRQLGTLTISQKQYIIDILTEFKMMQCKSTKTPEVYSRKLTAAMSPQTAEEEAEMESVPYLRLVGKLLYLTTCTRPDLAHALMEVCRFMQSPGKDHWVAVLHILRYLKGTVDLSVTFHRDDSPADSKLRTNDFYGYSDSDYAGDLDTRKSTESYVFMMAQGPISWRCKRQNIVTLSSTEAEYCAAGSAAKEALWLRQLLADLKLPQPSPTDIFEDNDGAISLSSNPISNARTKHIDVRHHFLRDRVESKEIILQHIDTADNIADLNTKALAPGKFKLLRSALLSREVKD
jgi:transposase InsO family protein